MMEYLTFPLCVIAAVAICSAGDGRHLLDTIKISVACGALSLAAILVLNFTYIVGGL